MSQEPVVLLVEDNDKHAQLVQRAFERLALPEPVRIATGEEALSWIGRNACELCLLDYDLPGIDGLETLVRLHQRKPDLPVIMMSNAQSEQVAITAYRSGITDYVPKKSGFDAAVAHLAQQHVRRHLGAEQAPQPFASVAVPGRLGWPTYENRLRLVGRHLDFYGYHTANILEVPSGFLIRALTRTDNRTPEALEILDSDFTQLVAEAYAMRGQKDWRPFTSPLLPTGYEDFLRALGHRLDAQYAEAVTITELDNFVAISGIETQDGSTQPFQSLLRSTDVAALIDEAFKRRQALKQP